MIWNKDSIYVVPKYTNSVLRLPLPGFVILRKGNDVVVILEPKQKVEENQPAGAGRLPGAK